MDKINQIIQQSNGTWKTQSQYFNWLRGQFRQAWNFHPIKLAYLKLKKYKNPKKVNNKTQWLIDCEICNEPTEFYPKNNIQVDHKKSAGSFKTVEDISNFITKLLVVTFEDLRCLCKSCHKVVTYSQKYGHTFEEAKFELKVVAFKKKSTKDQRYYLEGKGFSEEEISNAKKREDCYRSLIKNG